MVDLRIPISSLEADMYVEKGHVSWLRTLFLRHSLLVEHPSQIERSTPAGVKTVIQETR